MRGYFDQIIIEILPLVNWWWLDKTTTFATVASTRSYQPVAGNVTAWWSFVNETENRPMTIIGADGYDVADPDRSDTGSARAVFISGMDATTGYAVVDLFPLPDVADTIRARYRLDIATFTSANDATDLTILGLPEIIQNLMMYGGAAFYMEESGDDSGSRRERVGNYQRVLTAARKQNVAMQGNRRYVPPTDAEGPLFTTDNSIVVV